MPGGPGGPEVGRISIKVVPDTSGFREKLRAELAAIDRDIKVNITPDMDGFRAKVKAQTAGLSAKMKITPDIDRSAFARITAAMSGGGRSGGGGGAGGGMGAFRSIGGVPWQVLVGALPLLAPAVGILATGLATLPALLSAVALPIGAVALGLDGLKKAAESAALGGALEELKTKVSDVFEKGFTPILQQLGTGIPVLTDGFPKIAKGLTDMAQGVTNALTSSGGMDAIRTLFTNVGTMLTTAGPGLESFTTALVNLASKVSSHLPGAAAFFDEWAGKFSGWVDKISANGSLDAAVSNLKPVFDGIMGFVGGLMNTGIEMFSDPSQAAGIKNLIDSITTLSVDALPGLATAFVTLTDAISDITGALDALDKWDAPDWVKSSLNTAGSVVRKDPEPAQQRPYQEMGILDRLETGDFWQATLDRLKRGFDRTADFLKTQGSALVGFIVSAFQAIPTAIGDVASSVIEPFKKIPGAVADVAGAVMRAVTTLGSGVVAEFSRAFNAARDAVATAMANVVQAVTTGVGNIVAAFSNLGGQIVGKIQEIGSQMFSAGAAIIQRLIDGIKSVPIVGAVSDVLGAISRLVPHSPAEEGPFSGSGWTALHDGGAAIGNQLAAGITSSTDAVIASAEGLLATLQGTMGGASVIAGQPKIKPGMAGAGSSADASGIISLAQSSSGGKYSWGASNLASGLSDCSGAVSDLVELMTKGSADSGRLFYTGNAREVLSKLGAVEGAVPGALQIGWSSEHMRSTLPNGVAFESGGGTGQGATYGGSAQGAAGMPNIMSLLVPGSSAQRAGLAGLGDRITDEMDKLTLERKKLKTQLDSTDDKAEKDRLRDQMQKLDVLRDQLDVQKQQAKMDGRDVPGAESAGSKSGSSDPGSGIFGSLGSILDTLVKANVSQFESDLGISGKGAIPVIAEQGLAWAGKALSGAVAGMMPGMGGSTTNIQVNSVDEALAAKQNIANKQAMQFAGR